MSTVTNHPNANPNSPESLSPLHQTVLVALGAASTAVGAFIAVPIPFSPVPIVLQNFFILLIALILGPKMGTASVALYLLVGALGLPVFAGGKGGFAHFFGPTGGYLVGFILSAWITGTLSTVGAQKQGGKQPQGGIRFQDAVAVAAGFLAVYLLGVPWLSYKLGFDWRKALAAGFLPFLPGDLLKAAVAVIVAPQVRRLLKKEFLSDVEDSR